MRINRCGWVSVLVGGFAVGAAPGAARSEAPEDREAHLLESANGLFDHGPYGAAANTLETFLREFPKSAHAPEAAYKLASTYLLQNKKDQAQKAYQSLVADHPDSPWAKLAVTAHYDADALLKLANDSLAKAREPGRQEEAATALEFFKLYLDRFAAEKKNKDEIVYKMALCLHAVGDEDNARAALEQVRTHDKEGDWGKLAALRLEKSDKPFKDLMDDLMDMGAGDEPSFLFLERAENQFLSLDAGDRARCLFYKALCLEKVGKSPEALALCRTIPRDYPSSPFAAESALLLADKDFTDQKWDQAQAAYREVAKQYPHSPWGEMARRWADWMDEQDASWKEVEQVIGKLVPAVRDMNAGLSFTLRRIPQTDQKAVEIHLAYQEPHTNLKLAYGSAGFLLACNREGTWFRLLDQNFILHSKEPMELPAVTGGITVDPDTGDLKFNAGILSDRDQAGQPFSLPDSLPSAAVAHGKGYLHLHREVRKDGQEKQRVVFHFEYMVRRNDHPDTLDVVVRPDQTVREINWCSYDHDGKEMKWSLTDLALGKPLANRALAVSVPAGVQVREVKTINLMDILPQVCSSVGTLAQEVIADLPKK
jgi:TolA-binding protein